jgi:hypothetical protein
MKAAEEGEPGTAEHNEMKMAHHPVRIMNMHVRPGRPLNEPRETSYLK